MERVPLKDQPKLIAAVAILIVALGSIVASLLRTQTAAQPPQAFAQAAVPAPASAAAPNSSAATKAGGEESVWAAPESLGNGDSRAFPALALRRDPFQPLRAGKAEKPPVMIHASATHAPDPTSVHGPAADTGAIAAMPLPAPVLPGAGEPMSPNATTQPANLVPHLSPGSPAGEGPSAPPRDVRLAGTVGSGASGVAAFRVGEGLVPVRCAGEIAGWHVTRIEGARVWLTRGSAHRRMRVGERLEASTEEASSR